MNSNTPDRTPYETPVAKILTFKAENNFLGSSYNYNSTLDNVDEETYTIFY